VLFNRSSRSIPVNQSNFQLKARITRRIKQINDMHATFKRFMARNAEIVELRNNQALQDTDPANNFYYVHTGSVRIELESYIQETSSATETMILQSKSTYLPSHFNAKLIKKDLHDFKIRSIVGNDNKGTKLIKFDPSITKMFLERASPKNQKFTTTQINLHLHHAMPEYTQSNKHTSHTVDTHFELVVLKPNEILMKEGQAPEYYYVILSGNVEFYKKSQHHELQLKLTRMKQQAHHGLLFQTKQFHFEEPIHQSLVGIEVMSPHYQETGVPFTLITGKHQPDNCGQVVALRVSRQAFEMKMRPQRYYMEAMINRRLEQLDVASKNFETFNLSCNNVLDHAMSH
jgi:CRP-like cAMP-binding protein